MADKLPEPMAGGCDVGCGTCAFRAGSETRREPYNAIRAQLCEIGGVPFHCHHAKDGSDFHDRPGHAPALSQLRVCEGWKAAVRERAKDPKWRRNRLVARAFAEEAILAVEALTGDPGGKRRKYLLDIIRNNIGMLKDLYHGKRATLRRPKP